MSKVISYSLFGYNKERKENCFDFNSYLRGMMVNVRINRIIYPEWTTKVYMDASTYGSRFVELFDWLKNNSLMDFSIENNDVPLCKAMLWRLKPLFDFDERGFRPSHVICRDLDSVCTYREVQAVNKWIEEERAIHCITDSISHRIPMLGGMVGFNPPMILTKLGIENWDLLLSNAQQDYTKKGTDQHFMNQYLYPKFCDSATEHFIKGMKENIPEGEGRHYKIDDIDIGIDPKYRVIDETVGHIGAAGYYEIQMMRFLREIDPFEKEYEQIESQFPDVFYWRNK